MESGVSWPNACCNTMLSSHVKSTEYRVGRNVQSVWIFRARVYLVGEQKWEVRGLVGQCALLSCRPVSEDLQQANCPGRVDTSKRITHTNTYTRVYIHTYRNTHYTYTTTHSYLFIKDFQPLDCFKEESHS